MTGCFRCFNLGRRTETREQQRLQAFKELEDIQGACPKRAIRSTDPATKVQTEVAKAPRQTKTLLSEPNPITDDTSKGCQVEAACTGAFVAPVPLKDNEVLVQVTHTAVTKSPHLPPRTAASEDTKESKQATVERPVTSSPTCGATVQRPAVAAPSIASDSSEAADVAPAGLACAPDPSPPSSPPAPAEPGPERPLAHEAAAVSEAVSGTPLAHHEEEGAGGGSPEATFTSRYETGMAAAEGTSPAPAVESPTRPAVRTDAADAVAASATVVTEAAVARCTMDKTAAVTSPAEAAPSPLYTAASAPGLDGVMDVLAASLSVWEAPFPRRLSASDEVASQTVTTSTPSPRLPADEEATSGGGGGTQQAVSATEEPLLGEGLTAAGACGAVALLPASPSGVGSPIPAQSPCSSGTGSQAATPLITEGHAMGWPCSSSGTASQAALPPPASPSSSLNTSALPPASPFGSNDQAAACSPAPQGPYAASYGEGTDRPAAPTTDPPSPGPRATGNDSEVASEVGVSAADGRCQSPCGGDTELPSPRHPPPACHQPPACHPPPACHQPRVHLRPLLSACPSSSTATSTYTPTTTAGGGAASETCASSAGAASETCASSAADSVVATPTSPGAGDGGGGDGGQGSGQGAGGQLLPPPWARGRGLLPASPSHGVGAAPGPGMDDALSAAEHCSPVSRRQPLEVGGGGNSGSSGGVDGSPSTAHMDEGPGVSACSACMASVITPPMRPRSTVFAAEPSPPVREPPPGRNTAGGEGNSDNGNIGCASGSAAAAVGARPQQSPPTAHYSAAAMAHGNHNRGFIPLYAGASVGPLGGRRTPPPPVGYSSASTRLALHDVLSRRTARSRVGGGGGGGLVGSGSVGANQLVDMDFRPRWRF